MTGKNTPVSSLEKVVYGCKIIGRNNILFVVPHADLHEMRATQVVGVTCFHKATNAVVNTALPRSFINCNDVREIQGKNDSRALSFMDDVFRNTEGLLLRGSEPVYVIFVHCCPRVFEKERTLWRWEHGTLKKLLAGEKRPYAIDIGAGLCELPIQKKNNFQDYLAARYPLAAAVRKRMKNLGGQTCDRQVVSSLQLLLEKQGIPATVGLEWPAARLDNMVQAVKQRFSQAQILQLELVPDTLTEQQLNEAFFAIVDELITE